MTSIRTCGPIGRCRSERSCNWVSRTRAPRSTSGAYSPWSSPPSPTWSWTSSARGSEENAMTTRTVLRGGSVISADGPVRADVAVDGDEIVHVGQVDRGAADLVVDVSGRLVLPGFVDVHSHADGLLGDPDVALAL